MHLAHFPQAGFVQFVHAPQIFRGAPLAALAEASLAFDVLLVPASTERVVVIREDSGEEDSDFGAPICS